MYRRFCSDYGVVVGRVIMNNGAAVTFTNCIFWKNTAQFGGAINAFNSQKQSADNNFELFFNPEEEVESLRFEKVKHICVNY